jgi:hypothetical protein
MTDRLHSGLRTETIRTASSPGFSLIHVKIQQGKNQVLHSLHVRPDRWTNSGFQGTDVLSLAGFTRSGCAFQNGECYVSEIPEDFDLAGFGSAISRTLEHLRGAEQNLDRCGIGIDQPEGLGFFYHRRSSVTSNHPPKSRGNGHVSPQHKRMKQSEDDYFTFVLTWIEGGTDKGWTYHYRPKNPPLSSEMAAALEFIGEFRTFPECPEFDFGECLWRFLSYRGRDDNPFESNAQYAHSSFDAHSVNFSLGLKSLLAAHAELDRFGRSFLTIESSIKRQKAAPPVTPKLPPLPRPPSHGASITRRNTTPIVAPESEPKISAITFKYDVAVSFAGPERHFAETLANALRQEGFTVFYDNFYPEQLWGKDLVVFFDEVFRKQSRFCVIFVSRDYIERMWTNHERRSAQARALEEKGREYILPIKVDDSELPGMPSTIGYLSTRDFQLEQIVGILTAKLKHETRAV